MTLDEAIQHCAENIKKEEKNCNIACANEHKQLLEWLMQLKLLTGGPEQ